MDDGMMVANHTLDTFVVLLFWIVRTRENINFFAPKESTTKKKKSGRLVVRFVMTPTLPD